MVLPLSWVSSIVGPEGGEAGTGVVVEVVSMRGLVLEVVALPPQPRPRRGCRAVGLESQALPWPAYILDVGLGVGSGSDGAPNVFLGSKISRAAAGVDWIGSREDQRARGRGATRWDRAERAHLRIASRLGKEH